MADIKISEMTSAVSIDAGDFIELSQNVSGSQRSTKATIEDVAEAVKEIAFVDITGTLAIGQTNLVLQNNSITTTSTIDIYTDSYGVNPTNVVVAAGQITLTFESQSSAIGVKVRVS